MMRARGFTIVELLIVIVVIAILAAITIVAFRGVQDRAQASASRAGQSQLSRKIEIFKAQAAVYPVSISDCPSPAVTNVCIEPESGQTLSYFAFNTDVPPRFSAARHSTSIPGFELAVRNQSSFFYGANAEITSTNEFVQYMDMAPLIDQYGLRKYQISFDIKSADTSSASNVNVYMQNGSGAKYTFSVNVPVTTSYERRTITVMPAGPNAGFTQSILAFYGTYGTGNRPIVKNVEIQLAP